MLESSWISRSGILTTVTTCNPLCGQANWLQIDWLHMVFVVVCCWVHYVKVKRWTDRSMLNKFNLFLKTHLILFIQVFCICVIGETLNLNDSVTRFSAESYELIGEFGYILKMDEWKGQKKIKTSMGTKGQIPRIFGVSDSQHSQCDHMGVLSVEHR